MPKWLRLGWAEERRGPWKLKLTTQELNACSKGITMYLYFSQPLIWKSVLGVLLFAYFHLESPCGF